MKEFIEKLIGRLEKYKYSHLIERDSEMLEHCKEKEMDCEGSDCFLCVWDKATEIVNQLAEKYKEQNNDQDLMIVASLPSFYPMMQPFEIEAINRVVSSAKHSGGWIPCDCPLVPPDYCIVQIQEDNGYLWIPKVGEYRASTGKWRIEGAIEHSNGWLEDTEHFKVIAWQPLPQAYKLKE